MNIKFTKVFLRDIEGYTFGTIAEKPINGSIGYNPSTNKIEIATEDKPDIEVIAFNECHIGYIRSKSQSELKLITVEDLNRSLSYFMPVNSDTLMPVSIENKIVLVAGTDEEMEELNIEMERINSLPDEIIEPIQGISPVDGDVSTQELEV